MLATFASISAIVASAAFWLIVRSSSFVEREIRALSCSWMRSRLGAFGKAIRSIASLTQVARARNVPTAAGYWVAQACRAAAKAAVLSGCGCAGVTGPTGVAVDKRAGGGIGGAMQWLSTTAQATSATMNSSPLMCLPGNTSSRLASARRIQRILRAFQIRSHRKHVFFGKCKISTPLRSDLNPCTKQ